MPLNDDAENGLVDGKHPYLGTSLQPTDFRFEPKQLWFGLRVLTLYSGSSLGKAMAAMRSTVKTLGNMADHGSFAKRGSPIWMASLDIRNNFCRVI